MKEENEMEREQWREVKGSWERFVSEVEHISRKERIKFCQKNGVMSTKT